MTIFTDQIRPLYRYLRDFIYFSFPARKTRHGFKYIGSQHRFLFSADELGSILLVRSLAPKLKSFLNVGANSGYYCLLAETLGLEVICFEPERASFRLLQRNLQLNASSVLAIPLAVSSQRGRAKFFGSGTAGSLVRGVSGTPQWNYQEVLTDCLDNLFSLGGIAPQPTDSLWLLDCEGAEPEVLKGAIKLLTNIHPIIIVEYVPLRNQHCWYDSITNLQQYGYTHALACSTLVNGPQLWTSLSALNTLGTKFKDNILLISDYHHQKFLSCLPQGGPFSHQLL